MTITEVSKEGTYTRTRLAPTPSGYLHLGNVFSFVITAGLARRANAKILLRIDDLDKDRLDSKYVQDIFDTLNFLEIPWDEGPKNLHEYEHEYSQLHRMEMYHKALQQLKEEGRVFACTCSRAQVLPGGINNGYPGTCGAKNIPFDLQNISWRLRTDTKEVTVKTIDGAITAPLPVDMQGFIVKKKDTFPAYQLASVLDDVYFGVDLVVRGDDLFHSTLAQLYLSSVLRKDTFSDTVFYHHPLLLDNHQQKLSKSEGATSVYYLRKEHKTPADIFTMTAKSVGINERVNNWQELFAAIRPMLFNIG